MVGTDGSVDASLVETNIIHNNNNDNKKVDDEQDPPRDSDDRILRRLLKKHLKQRNKLRKHETRMQQAIFRNDVALETRARKDWEDCKANLRDDPNSFLNYKEAPPTLPGRATTDSEDGFDSSRCFQLNQGSRFRHIHPSLRSMDERDTKRVQEIGSPWLLEFRQKLVPSILSSYALKNNNNNSESKSDGTANGEIVGSMTAKKRQTLHAAQLKANMQQGTQTKAMFADELALLGYTRQKFYERAMLAFSSLDRLDPSYCDENENENDDENNNATNEEDGDNVCDRRIPNTIASSDDGTENQKKADDRAMFVCVWGRLMATKQVVSIGCGPGCDAVGVLGFFESHGVKLSNGMVLTDFVIDAWKDLVLESLEPMIVPSVVPFVRTVACDVREALLPEIIRATTSSNNESSTISSSNHAAFVELTETSKSSHRLVVVSYLLTETRHKWKAFFGHLLGMLHGTESLLLLTEPTAWQLHEFLRCFGRGNGDDESNENDANRGLLIKAHVWLDSSRDLPHLQGLDSRNGPAILLVCTN